MSNEKPKIAVIVPTIREACFEKFVHSWFEYFQAHDVFLVKVLDGDEPEIHSADCSPSRSPDSLVSFLERDSSRDFSRPKDENNDLFSDHNPACRNLGFYYAAIMSPKFDVFITLDDDCFPPDGKDPIAEHLYALERRWPLSWFSTTDHFHYMRGFPYKIREEAECVVSHGLWHKNPDLDAISDIYLGSLRSTQRLDVNNEEDYRKEKNNLSAMEPGRWYCGPIPKGVCMPFCGMNVAFKREVLPWYYHCPVENFPGCERFDDIWMGLSLKKTVDELMPGKCIVSGCSVVNHIRASDPFSNLAKEAVGIKINENLWRNKIDDEYRDFFADYEVKKTRYEELLKPLV